MKPVCSVDYCDRPARAKSLCEGHYQQAKAGKPFSVLRVIKPFIKGELCAFEGCNQERSPKAGFGFCSRHYSQYKAGLDLSLTPYRIASYKGEKCKFEGCDRNARSNGLCNSHDRQRRNGQELYPMMTRRKPNKDDKCRIEGCGASHNAHGMCLNHYTIWNTHGLEPEVYEKMFEDQGYVCAICKKECVSKRRLSVDHNHDTGEIRGLLCAKCNRAIGLLGDSLELIRAAADYLIKNDSIYKVA